MISHSHATVSLNITIKPYLRNIRNKFVNGVEVRAYYRYHSLLRLLLLSILSQISPCTGNKNKYKATKAIVFLFYKFFLPMMYVYTRVLVVNINLLSINPSIVNSELSCNSILSCDKLFFTYQQKRLYQVKLMIIETSVMMSRYFFYLYSSSYASCLYCHSQ